MGQIPTRTLLNYEAPIPEHGEDPEQNPHPVLSEGQTHTRTIPNFGAPSPE